MIDDVLIIDDLEEDLNGISLALAKEAYSVIPLNYRDENFTSLYEKIKKKNVRLIITDMELQTSDLTGSDRTREHAILATSILDSIISNEQLYVLVVWTTHEKQYDEFISILHERLERLGKPLPLHTYSLFKERCKTREGEYDGSIILEQFNQYLDENQPFKALLDWENNCKLASRDTVNILTNSVNSNDITKTLSSLAKQINRKNLDSNKKYAIYEAMQPLFFDSVSNMVINVDEKLWESVIKKESEDLSDEEKIKLNTKLHIKTYDNYNLELIYPGDFLEIIDNKVFNYLSEQGLPNFIEESSWNDKNKRCLLNGFLQCKKLDRNTIRKCASDSIIGLLEISPACDFANNKREPFKFYALTILCPVIENIKYENNGNVFGNFYITVNNKKYFICISANYLFSVPNKFIAFKDKNENCRFKKLFRIRKNILNRITQDIANHNSRIGTILFD